MAANGLDPEVKQVLMISIGIFCMLSAFSLARLSKNFFVPVVFAVSGLVCFTYILDLHKLYLAVTGYIEIELEKATDVINEEKQDRAVQVASLSHNVKILQEFMNNQLDVNKIQVENNQKFQNFGENQKSLNESIVMELNKFKDNKQNLLDKLKEVPDANVIGTEDSKKFKDLQDLFNENGKYSVLVYFRGGREIDASAINKILLNNGYKSAIIQTSLKEVNVKDKPEPSPGSIAIMPLTGFGDVAGRIAILLGMAVEVNKNNILLWSEYKLKRGNVQIYLF
ncbi:hypothetical protein [Azospirillum sp. B2RO_4]|uniref:hypothetical protein n=1 Tax=Azospirillum sp. B2RO_4 TaxID=3027796 RepID=UPI003DA93CFC